MMSDIQTPNPITGQSQRDHLFQRVEMAIGTAEKLKDYSNEVRQEVSSRRKVTQQNLHKVRQRFETMLKNRHVANNHSAIELNAFENSKAQASGVQFVIDCHSAIAVSKSSRERSDAAVLKAKELKAATEVLKGICFKMNL